MDFGVPRPFTFVIQLKMTANAQCIGLGRTQRCGSQSAIFTQHRLAAILKRQRTKRDQFRRAMKRAMQNAMRVGAKGIKIMTSGRLNGADIARSEWYREGRVPLHTLRANVDYATSEAHTTYGVLGLKVWVYTGEGTDKAQAKPEQEKRQRKAGGRHAAAN